MTRASSPSAASGTARILEDPHAQNRVKHTVTKRETLDVRPAVVNPTCRPVAGEPRAPRLDHSDREIDHPTFAISLEEGRQEHGGARARVENPPERLLRELKDDATTITKDFASGVVLARVRVQVPFGAAIEVQPYRTLRVDFHGYRCSPSSIAVIVCPCRRYFAPHASHAAPWAPSSTSRVSRIPQRHIHPASLAGLPKTRP